MNDGRNTFGQAYGLTVLAPIVEQRESSLARLLDSLEGGAESPLARVTGTHFARWALIGDVVYEGSGKRDHLSTGRLLFTSNFDGKVEPYIEALRTGLGPMADSIWGHCQGYPGSADPRAFFAYIRAHQVESSLFFAAYGERTVEEVKTSLQARHQVIDFAMRAQGMNASELKSAFEGAFPA